MTSTHIFLCFYNLGLGGVQRKIVDIVNHIDSQPKYNHLKPHIIIRQQARFTFEKLLPSKFKNIHLVPKLDPIPHRLVYLGFLIYLYLRFRPKAVFAYLQHSAFYVTLTKLLLPGKSPKIIIGQDNLLSMDNKPPYVVNQSPPKLITWYYQKADKIIVQTQYAKKDLVKSFRLPSKQIVVIPNWVTDIKYKPRQKLTDVIYCGRFSPQKDLVRLLKTVSIVKHTHPKLRVRLIGQGKDKQKLKRFIAFNKLKKQVIIKGVTHQVKQELIKSKLFVLTSKFEGHPMILLEAMAMKVIPIVISYPGANEYIVHGKTGFIEKDEQALAKRIIKLLNNHQLRQQISNQTRNQAIKIYNSSLIDKTLKLALNKS